MNNSYIGLLGIIVCYDVVKYIITCTYDIWHVDLPELGEALILTPTSNTTANVTLEVGCGKN